jgi:hypothetical protein
MIFVDRVVVGDILGDAEIVMCRREFQREAMFNIEQRGIRFDEYEGKTLDELYPYVGCAVAMKDGSMWQVMLQMYEELPEKFRKWYGDQEVLREFGKRYAHDEIPESVIGCLPEHKHEGAKILHYKGPSRKPLFEAM